MYKTLLLAIVIALGVGLMFAPTNTGVAQYDRPIEQYVDRFLFHQNIDGSWDVVFSLYLELEAGESHTVILPLPAAPTGITEGTAFEMVQLQATTEPLAKNPLNQCEQLFPVFQHGSFGPPYDILWEAEIVQSNTYTTTNIDELLSDGYQVSDTRLSRLRSYDDDTAFWVIEFAPIPDAVPNDDGMYRLFTSAVRFTVPSLPSIDPALLRDENHQSILAWFLAFDGYTTDNYPVGEVDLRGIRASSEVENIGTGLYAGNATGYDEFQDWYELEIARLTTLNGGQVVIPQMRVLLGYGLERTRSISYTLIDPADLPLVGDLVQRDGTITRLFISVAPSSSPEPITFAADSALPTVPQMTNIGDFEASVNYYGCHTATEDNLTATFDAETMQLYRDDWSKMTVAVPNNWVSQTVMIPESWYMRLPEEDICTANRQAMWPLTIWHNPADEVSLDSVRAYLNGESTPPMIIVAGVQGFVDYAMTPLGVLYSLVNPPTDTINEWQFDNAVPSSFRGTILYPASANGERWVTGAGMGVFYLLPDDITADDLAVFENLLDYTRSRRYYAIDNYEHTLFLSESQISYGQSFRTVNALTLVPFPTDSVVGRGVVEDETVITTPDGITLTIRPLAQFQDPNRDLAVFSADKWVSLNQYLQDVYGLQLDVAPIIEDVIANEQYNGPIAFENGDNYGYVMITPTHVIGVQSEDVDNRADVAALASSVVVQYVPNYCLG